MKKHIIFLIILLFTVNSWGWDDQDTHPRITEYTAKQFFDPDFLLKELVLDAKSLRAEKWLQEGAKLEDEGTLAGFVTGFARSLYHFHDPTKPLSEAGLSDLPLPPKMSTVLWSQNPSAQSGAKGGDWSWQKVRTHQYAYLTAINKADKDANLARQLLGLGYQMHLIQDMSQPNHVRNDTHMDDGVGKKPKYGFETWVKTKFDKVNAILANNFMIVMNTSSVDLTSAYEGGLAPVARLYDTRNNLRVDTTVVPNMTYITPSISYSQGMAEYTSANFYSENSIFAAERRAVGNRFFFPYPKKSETDVQRFIDKSLPTIPFVDRNKTYQNFRIGKTATTGEALNCVAKPTIKTANYYRAFGEGQFFYGSFVADEECFEEQANKLLPRAAGYSIAMLNYFFRGKLEIYPPDQQVYTITDGSKIPQQFTTIKAKVMNTTPNEAILAGSLVAIASYKVDPNYAPDLSNSPTHNTSVSFAYSVSAPVTIQLNMNLAPIEYTFDFSNSKIPAGITDLTLQVVFQGTLGNEANSAVAVGMKDLSEPTHHVVWNDTDMFSLDDQLYTAQQIRGNPTLAARAGDAQIDPYDITFTISYTSNPNSAYFSPEVATAVISAGRHMRLIGIFDNETANHLEMQWSGIGSESYNVVQIQPVKNQDYGTTWLSTPASSPFRNWLDTDGVTKHSFMQHFNTGILSCKPLLYDVAGKPFCSYPVEQAIPAVKTPIGAIMD